MSVTMNPVVGALVGADGKLEPIFGPDPSAQWTYREPNKPDRETTPAPKP